MAKKVIVPLADGFEEIEALTIVDILRRADVDVMLAALETIEVKGAHGVVVKADALISTIDATQYDMIALPGGLPGATNLARHEGVQSIIKSFDTQQKYIAAICAAPYALFTAGVLKNAYTCYPGFHSNITHDGYKSDDTVVVDSHITTSQGPSTAMAFSLSLVEQLCSKETAQKLASDLLLA